MKAIESSVALWAAPATREGRMRHIERAGRVCYKSEDKMTDDSTEKFLRAVLGRGHLSVFEHGNIILKPPAAAYLWLSRAIDRNRANGIPSYLRLTRNGSDCTASGNVRAWHDFFTVITDSDEYVPPELASLVAHNGVLFADIPLPLINAEPDGYTGGTADPHEVFELIDEPAQTRLIHGMATLQFTVDRGVSHELVRHRTLSFSQESTRYCNYSKDKFGREITVIKPPYADESTKLYPAWFMGCVNAERAYFSMLDAGATAQEARTVLPNSLKTEVIVTGHYDDWLKFLKLRTAPDAHPDIRKVAISAGHLLAQIDPEVFAQYGDKATR